MKLTLIVKKHPIISYFVLAFGIAWIGSIIAVGPKFLRAEPMGVSDTLLFLLVMLAGPSIAGVALTGLIDGRVGLQDLLARMGQYRVGRRWYAAAILIPPILILAVLVPLSIVVGPQFAPALVPIGLLIGLIVGFFEEVGWSGFAYPRMKVLHGALVGAIYLGLLHSTWHIVADFMGSSQTLGAAWFPHFLAFMTLSMTAMRVLISWVYVNTGSVLLAQLMHASSTGFLYTLGPRVLSPQEDTLWYAIYGLLLWLAVAIISARYGRMLSSASNRPGPPEEATR